MYKKLSAIVCFIGLLTISVALSTFSTKTTDVYADDTISLTGNVVIQDEAKPEDPPLFEPGPDTVNGFSRDTLTGITYDKFLKSSSDRERLREPYMRYDQYNLIFQQINQIITPSQAHEKLKTISVDDPETYEQMVTTYDNDVQGFNTSPVFKNKSMDYAKTKRDAGQPIIPEPSKTDPTSYDLGNLAIWLVANNYQMTIKYVVPGGAVKPDDRSVTGYIGEDAANIDSPDVPGYVPNQKSVKVDFSKDSNNSTINVTYNKPNSNTGSQPTTNQASLTADKTATVMAGQSITAATFGAKATDSDGKDIPVTVDTSKVNVKVPGSYPVTLSSANGKSMTVTVTIKVLAADTGTITLKQSEILSVKTLYLYRKATFNKKQRLVKYPKAARGNRPMFLVMGTAHSKTGLLRYHVKDINRKRKTMGKTGYITAKSKYVTPAYYQKKAKHVKVISKHGINEYKKVNLTGKIRHVKKGKALKVVGVKHHNLTTRFRLSNGYYITADKNLVVTVK